MHTKIQNHIEYIQSKGFIISDEEKVIGYLEKVGFHRLRRYFNTVERYEGTDFQRIIDAYVFDKKLRGLCLSILEPIELSFKNQILISCENILDPNIFKENSRNERIKFISEKIKILEQNDPEIKYYLNFQKDISDILIDKLNFGEVFKIFSDLKPDYQYSVIDYYGIDNRLFHNWFLCFVYLRNLCSHGENICNRKMTFSLKSREILNLFGISQNNYFISYFSCLGIMRKILIPEYKWERKIFSIMNEYHISPIILGAKKETSHSQLESEAWEVLVNQLYTKISRKAK